MATFASSIGLGILGPFIRFNLSCLSYSMTSVRFKILDEWISQNPPPLWYWINPCMKFNKFSGRIAVCLRYTSQLDDVPIGCCVSQACWSNRPTHFCHFHLFPAIQFGTVKYHTTNTHMHFEGRELQYVCVSLESTNHQPHDSQQSKGVNTSINTNA